MMQILKWLAFRSKILFRRGAKDVELDREMQAHLQMMIDDGIASGLLEKEARQGALREFGNVQCWRADCRDVWGAKLWIALMDALRFSFRLLFKQWTTSVLAVVVLAMGLGVSVSMYSIARDVLWSGNGTKYGDRVVWVEWVTENGRGRRLERSQIRWRNRHRA